jgi:hypothetical protein
MLIPNFLALDSATQRHGKTRHDSTLVLQTKDALSLTMICAASEATKLHSFYIMAAQIYKAISRAKNHGSDDSQGRNFVV